MKNGVRGAFYKWSDFKAPPANRVALQVGPWNTIGPGEANNLHLPLSLNQLWHIEKTRDGASGYRWGFFNVRGQQYDVAFWSGPDAPPHDRAAVLNALVSIRPA